MESDQIRQKIRTLLTKYIRNREFKDNDDIFALKFVNSLFAMQMVLFVEKEFGLKLKNQDLSLQNFNSVDAITRFVEKRLQGL